MTGSASDPPAWQPHIRNKALREMLAKRFRDPADPLQIVLVRHMWLTGFDAPSLHTMYVDKPMRGHGLMQAIARVHRVFRDKPGGLIVDYLGLAHELKRALATYTGSGGMGKTALDQSEAVAVMLEKYEVCRGLIHGFDYAAWTDGTPSERVSLLPGAQEHILAQESGKERYLRAERELSQAFTLAVPHEEAIRIRDDVAFFQAVRSVLAKRGGGEARPEEELDYAMRQIVSRAVASEGVIDVFAAAGLEKPDISILSEDFLAEVQGMKQRNLAAELLRKLLKGELAVRKRKNVVQARSFAEMLEQTVRRYANRGPSRERPRPPAPAGQAHPAKARLSARQAGEGDADGARTSGGAVRWLRAGLEKQMAVLQEHGIEPRGDGGAARQRGAPRQQRQQLQALGNDLEVVRKETRKQLKVILTKEQFKEFKQMQEEGREALRQRIRERAGESSGFGDRRRRRRLRN